MIHAWLFSQGRPSQSREELMLSQVNWHSDSFPWWHCLPAETQTFARLKCQHAVTILPRLAVSFLCSFCCFLLEQHDTHSHFSSQWWLCSSHSVNLQTTGILYWPTTCETSASTFLVYVIDKAAIDLWKRKNESIQERTNDDKAFGKRKNFEIKKNMIMLVVQNAPLIKKA